jgi:hypothetical protein
MMVDVGGRLNDNDPSTFPTLPSSLAAWRRYMRYPGPLSRDAGALTLRYWTRARSHDAYKRRDRSTSNPHLGSPVPCLLS